MNTLYIKPTETTKEFYINHRSAFVGDSGIDLFFPETIELEPLKTTIIDLGISCEMYCGDNLCSYFVYPRSSISKTPLIMHNSVGIIDSNYRHSIKVAIRNLSNQFYTINKGEKLFQICAPNLGEIKLILKDNLSETTRGSGFGSSGK